MWEAIPYPPLYARGLPVSSLPKQILLDTIDALQNLEEFIHNNPSHDDKPKNKSIERIKELAQLFSPPRKRLNKTHMIKILSRDSTLINSTEELSTFSPSSLSKPDNSPDLNLLTSLRNELSHLQQRYSDLIETELLNPVVDTTIVISPPVLAVCDVNVEMMKLAGEITGGENQLSPPGFYSRGCFPGNSGGGGEGREIHKKRKVSSSLKQQARFSLYQPKLQQEKESSIPPVHSSLKRTTSVGILPGNNKENNPPQSAPRPSHRTRKSKEKFLRAVKSGEEIPLFGSFAVSPATPKPSSQKLVGRAKQSSTRWKERNVNSLSPI